MDLFQAGVFFLIVRVPNKGRVLELREDKSSVGCLSHNLRFKICFALCYTIDPYVIQSSICISSNSVNVRVPRQDTGDAKPQVLMLSRLVDFKQNE